MPVSRNLIRLDSFSGWLGKRLSEIRSNATSMIDERLRLMSEIISGVQVIKMYAWEKPFSTLVEHARKYSLSHGVMHVRITCTIIRIISERKSDRLDDFRLSKR